MVSVFKKEEVIQEKTVVEIVKESLDVDASGTVRFRSRTGRGSGKAVEIPGEQFEEFVKLMLRAKASREELIASQQVEAVATAEPSKS